jgi:taurine dioxygenase
MTAIETCELEEGAPMSSIIDPNAIRPIGAGLGVELAGVDLAAVSAEMLEAIAGLYRRNRVMVIRGQSLGPDQLVRFGQALGALEDHTRQQFTLPGYPTIYILSNKEVDGRRIGVHRDGLGWHTDGTYLEKPLDSTVLYALEAPPEGGETLLADMRAAFDALPEEERSALQDKRVLHSFVYLIGNLDPQARSVVTEEQRNRAPDVIHPLVLTDPQDGTHSLYLSSGSSKAVLGMDEEAGRALVRRLIDHATQERFVYRHVWQAGDILVWNNLYTMHRATPYDDVAYERLVYRLWVTGERRL